MKLTDLSIVEKRVLLKEPRKTIVVMNMFLRKGINVQQNMSKGERHAGFYSEFKVRGNATA